MYKPAYTTQFSKDRKRGKNPEKLKLVIRSLLAGEPLNPLHRNHKLVGNYAGRWECHIESDWLLIYKLQADLIIFERTGTHSDLFQE